VFGSNTGALGAAVGGGAIAAPRIAPKRVTGWLAAWTLTSPVRLRQTISVFCSPSDRTRPAMQFFGPPRCADDATEELSAVAVRANPSEPFKNNRKIMARGEKAPAYSFQ
jgi:hypothetical protein